MAVMNIRDVVGKVKFKGTELTLFKTLVKANGQKDIAGIRDMLVAGSGGKRKIKVESLKTAISQLRSSFREQSGAEFPACWNIKQEPGAGRGRKAVTESMEDALNSLDLGDLDLELTAVDSDSETESGETPAE